MNDRTPKPLVISAFHSGTHNKGGNRHVRLARLAAALKAKRQAAKKAAAR